jgi:hypothetical protein
MRERGVKLYQKARKMVSILAHAQKLVYILLSLMPSQNQRENLEAMLGLFLEDQGQRMTIIPHILDEAGALIL